MATVPRSSKEWSSLAIEVAVKSAFESLGYTSVRKEQMESAMAILWGQDVFVSQLGVENLFARLSSIGARIALHANNHGSLSFGEEEMQAGWTLTESHSHFSSY